MNFLVKKGRSITEFKRWPVREIILELSEEDSRNYRKWLLMREDWYFPFPERYSDLTFSGCKITSGQSEAIPLFTRNILPLTAYLLKKNPTPELHRCAVILMMKSCYAAFRNAPPVIHSGRLKTFLNVMADIYSFAYARGMKIDDQNCLHVFKIKSWDEAPEISKHVADITDFISSARTGNLLHALPQALHLLGRINATELTTVISGKYLTELLPVVSVSMKYCPEDYDDTTSHLHQSRYAEHQFKSGEITISVTAITFPLNPFSEVYQAIDTEVCITHYGSGFYFGWPVLRELVTAAAFLCAETKVNHNSNYRGKEVFTNFNAEGKNFNLTIASFTIQMDIITFRQFISGLNSFFEMTELKIILEQVSHHLGNY